MSLPPVPFVQHCTAAASLRINTWIGALVITLDGALDGALLDEVLSLDGALFGAYHSHLVSHSGFNTSHANKVLTLLKVLAFQRGCLAADTALRAFGPVLG